jgi:hypothetical protein
MEIEVDMGASDDQGLGYFEDGGAAPADGIGSPSPVSKKKRKSRPKLLLLMMRLGEAQG